ncbi:MAG: YtxH domain-containing protein [Chitinophagales bacterium]|nr:YtxH domain-containing protein [Bacteroidota bacterium]MCB9043007.1 YtxH domain-containing protein [Chitinophagales bacterium]
MKVKHAAYLFSGIILGGVTALLLAPEKGSKTRKKLKKQALDIQQELQHQADKGMVKLNEMKEVGMKNINELRDKGMKTINEMKTAAEELMENTAKKVNNKTKEEIEEYDY